MCPTRYKTINQAHPDTHFIVVKYIRLIPGEYGKEDSYVILRVVVLQSSNGQDSGLLLNLEN